MKRIDVTIRPVMLESMRLALMAAGVPATAMTFTDAAHVGEGSTVVEVCGEKEHVFDMTPVITLEVVVTDEQAGTACQVIEEVMTVGRQRGRVTVTPVTDALTETDRISTPKPGTVPAHKRMEGYL